MIIVSACLLGISCRYNGKSALSEKLATLLKDENYLLVCPEVCGGLKIPRKPIELFKGRAIEKDGTERTKKILLGCEIILQQINGCDVEYAILQSRSPSCGKGKIYDGTFTGTLVEGDGLFVKCLKKEAIKVYDVDEFCSQKEIKRQN